MDIGKWVWKQWKNKTGNICNELHQYGLITSIISCKAHKNIAVNIDIIITNI